MDDANEAAVDGLANNPFIEIGLPVSLFIIMIGVGLTLRPRDFHNVVYYPKALVLGSIAQILLMPCVAFALAYAFGLSEHIAVGLVIIAACPGGATSNVFAFLAKGNLALSILMTALASLITILTIPVFTNFALGLFADQALEEPIRLPVVDSVVTLSVIILVPVSIGMFVRSRSAAIAGRLEGAVSAFGLFVLLLLIGLITYSNRHDLADLLVNAGPPVIALNLLGAAVGFACGWIARAGFRDGLTLGIEMGIKNATIGMMVPLTLLDSPQMAMAPSIYGLLMYVTAIAMIVVGRRHAHLNPIPEADEIPLHIPDDPGFPDDHPEAQSTRPEEKP
jgi:bile acid:Na+ symporter, BASS family